MKYIKYLIILNFIAMISACGKSGSEQDKLFETQRNALDQAKQVDQKLQQQAQDLRQSIEQQTPVQLTPEKQNQ